MNIKTPRKKRVAMTRDEYDRTLADILFRLELDTGVEWGASWENGVATMEPAR